MAKRIWKTTFFEIAEQLGLSLNELGRRGSYSVGYLSYLKNGHRAIPDSIDFQDWAASVVGKTREQIFFAEPLANDNDLLPSEKAS
jgi:transcriptional regulator with XRE-family HTH domain